MNKNDARVRFTLSAIKSSFFDLIGEKPYTRITVTELCARSGINRATFYKHYIDVQDVLDKLCEEAVDAMFNRLDTAEWSDFESVGIELLEAIKSNDIPLVALCGPNGAPSLANRILRQFYDRYYMLLKNVKYQMDDEAANMAYSFITQGSLGVIAWWIMEGMRVPSCYVVALIKTMCINALTDK